MVHITKKKGLGKNVYTDGDSRFLVYVRHNDRWLNLRIATRYGRDMACFDAKTLAPALLLAWYR